MQNQKVRNLIYKLLLTAVFKNAAKDKTIAAFINVLKMAAADTMNFESVLTAYSDFTADLYETEPELNLYNHIKNLVYTDENVICANISSGIRSEIKQAAEYELAVFDELLKYDYSCIKSLLMSKYPKYEEILNRLPEYNTAGRERFNLEDIIKSYKTNGFGIFAKYKAFNFSGNKTIIPVKYFEAMTFNSLKQYEYQKNVLYSNTKAFVNGKEANNILLYGDRGCGKSSSVKALINEFKDYNLKIIQTEKTSLVYLNELYDKIRPLPLKFIIFADDITFEENDKNFSAIKSALEGGLSAKPKNAVIYASANRRHLVKESFSERSGDEVHANDTIDEITSLSDRFGITLTFSLLNKNEYLDTAKQIAADAGISTDEEMLRKAEEFALLKGIRTPRTAVQFLIDYTGQKHFQRQT